MKENRIMRRAVSLALAAALLCLALALGGCRQRERTFTVRSAWGDGSISFKLAATKPKANEAGTRLEFQSVLGLNEIADAIAWQLPENAALERPGGNILLRQTVGEGENAVTDFFFLAASEMPKLDLPGITDGEKEDPKGTKYVLSCMDTEFVTPEGRRLRFLFPAHLMIALGDRVPAEALPMDTSMRYNEIGNRALLEFYGDFGRYNTKFVDGAVVLNGYTNLPEGVDEFKLPPMGERVYLTVEGLVNDYTVKVSLSPPPAKR